MGWKDQVAGRFPVGIAAPVDNDTFAGLNVNDRTDGGQEIILENFSQLTPENSMKPDRTAPQQGVYDFARGDTLVAFAQANNLTIHGHSLIFESVSNPQTPDWMRNFNGNAAQFQAALDQYITDVMTHWHSTSTPVISWDVVNEAFDDNGNRQPTTFQNRIGDDHIRFAFEAARAADPGSLLYLTDFHISRNIAKTDAVVAEANSLNAMGLIDGIGLQMHILEEDPSDFAIRESFRKCVSTGLLVKVCELDIRMNFFAGSATNPLSPAREIAQGEKYFQVLRAYLEEVPPAQRGGFSIWGLSDPESWLYNTGAIGRDFLLPWNGDLSEKAAVQRITDAFDQFLETDLLFEILAPVDDAVDVVSPVSVAGSAGLARDVIQVEILDDDGVPISAFGDVNVSVFGDTWIADPIDIPQNGKFFDVRARAWRDPN